MSVCCIIISGLGSRVPFLFTAVLVTNGVCFTTHINLISYEAGGDKFMNRSSDTNNVFPFFKEVTGFKLCTLFLVLCKSWSSVVLL
jgi:hypothetical protein